MPPRKRQPTSAPPAGDSQPFRGGGSNTSPRRGRQLGLRVPEELYQRLGQIATETGISRQRLLVDALNAWLKRYEQPH